MVWFSLVNKSIPNLIIISYAWIETFVFKFSLKFLGDLFQQCSNIGSKSMLLSNKKKIGWKWGGNFFFKLELKNWGGTSAFFGGNSKWICPLGGGRGFINFLTSLNSKRKFWVPSSSLHLFFFYISSFLLESVWFSMSACLN